jgi:N-acetylmuramoyl-L-alanine amidase
MIIASGMLYGYYHFFLRNKKFHRYNRFFLLGTVIISIIIPFINIPVYFSKESTDSSVLLQTLSVISYSGGEETTAVVLSESTNQIASWLSWQNIIYSLYILIALIFIVRIYLSVRKIRIISSNYPQEKIGDIHFVNTSEPGTPFSFFKWLFWNKDIELNSDKGQQIFRHELFHINQRHTLDTVFMEFITALAWFNPVFHLIKKEVKTIHEFLADEYAMSKSGDWQYAELLLMQALNTKLSLVNPFFHTQIKRRIAMITTSQKPGHQYLRKLLVLPVAAVIAILFAFSYKNKKAENSTAVKSSEAITIGVDAGHRGNDKGAKSADGPVVKSSEHITIIVDAGHGGNDKGAKSADGNFNEAQLNLEISKMIQQLASEYNINVIMTREGDDLPGGVTTVSEALKKRVEISNHANPHAFISIHVNTAGKLGENTRQSGFDFYISNKQSIEKDRLLASAVINEVSKIYKSEKNIKQRSNKGLWVLDANKSPSLIIECGYINNTKDLAFITNKSGQEKIARAILRGVSQFANSKTVLVQEKISVDTPKRKIPDSVVVKGNIKIRQYDPTSVNDSSKVLIVLDGKIIENISMNQLDQYLKPEDIESVTVLKNESAISKYGEKAKNGVIEIITKKDKSVEIKNDIVSKTSPDNKVFVKVEKEPSFPGGAEAWKIFLRKNLNSAAPVDSGAKAGIYKTKVQFIVDKDGNTGSFRALTKNGFGMEEEVIRVISTGPKWIPALQNGKVVNAYMVQSVTFQFTEDITESDLPPVTKPEFTKSKPLENGPKTYRANELPQISITALQKATVYDLTKLQPGTEISTFTFGMDNSMGFIDESVNAGNDLNVKTKELIKNAKQGRIITIDNIFILKEGVKKKIPGRVYGVSD